MTKEKYIEDLQQIRSIMDRSSRFISLSGMSGVIAGTLALVGAYVAYKAVYQDQSYLSYRKAILTSESIWTLIGTSVIVLVFSLTAGIILTQRKAKKANQKLWDSQAKRLLINLLIPLVVGGVLCLILLSKGFIGLVAPLTLLFYGLALVNASKYTLSEIRGLGLAEIALGLLGCQFVGYG
ncbi:MAG: hypothetical protein KI790_12475, partial [Cyclobacteriaceae bacterium]|nr:hypothetical protein [Cyclobacteriaceae bacterium HetDA_MAG_MS6]